MGPPTNGRGPESPWQGPGPQLSSGKRDDHEHTLTHADIEAKVGSLSMEDLFRVTDPTRPWLDFIAGEKVRGWLKCPRCHKRGIGINDSVRAFCALCGRRWTRWSIGRHLLADPEAVQRLADAMEGD